MIASLPLNERLHYRPDAFRRGLERLGYHVKPNPLREPGPNDVLVIWNRMPRHEEDARRYEAAGATVLVTENAWLGPDDKEEHCFALCRSHHNGAGSWEVGDYSRRPKLGIEVRPWREGGEHLLLLPQRGFGEKGVAMPRDWLSSVTRRLQKATDRPIKLRVHPGKRPHPLLDPLLRNCWAVVTWGSGAAIKAIAYGVPVFYEMKDWIGSPAAVRGIGQIEEPFVGDREPMLERLAWAQWSAAEIESGEPFKWLLCRRE